MHFWPKRLDLGYVPCRGLTGCWTLAGEDLEYLIAAIQNIEVLLRDGEQPKKSLLVKVNQITGKSKGVKHPISGMINCLMVIGTNGIRPLDYKPCWFRRNW